MASNELEATASSVPALASTPSVEIGADDVALPRLKIGQYSSDLVQDGPVEAGDLFTSLSSDDPDPVILDQGDDGVLIHVLAMRKGKSISDGGELFTFDFHDPDAPADAWVTYNYVIALPEVDDTIPYKLLLTRTGQPAAKQINLVLARTGDKGPAYNQAFRLSTAAKENKKGKFYVPRVRHVDATEEGIASAESLATLISADSATVESTGDDPAI